jgi:hypothetical protein
MTNTIIKIEFPGGEAREYEITDELKNQWDKDPVSDLVLAIGHPKYGEDVSVSIKDSEYGEELTSKSNKTPMVEIPLELAEEMLECLIQADCEGLLVDYQPFERIIEACKQKTADTPRMTDTEVFARSEYDHAWEGMVKRVEFNGKIESVGMSRGLPSESNNIPPNKVQLIFNTLIKGREYCWGDIYLRPLSDMDIERAKEIAVKCFIEKAKDSNNAKGDTNA